MIMDTPSTFAVAGRGVSTSPADEPASRVAQVLWRRKWLLILVTAVVTALSVIFGMRMEPKFMASALVMFNVGGPQVLDMKAVVDQLTGDAATMATELEVLNSRTLVADVVQRLGLVGDPELTGGPRRSDPDWLIRVRALLNEAVEALWPMAAWSEDRALRALVASDATKTSPVESLPSSTEVFERTLQGFKDRLRVVQQGSSFVIKVSFTSTDPAKAARIANSVADRFIEQKLEAKQAATESASSWLGRRLVEMRQELEQLEQAEQSFRATNGLIVVNGINVLEQELGAVAQAAVSARERAAEKQATLDQVEKLASSQGRIDASPEVVNSPLILALRTQEADLLRQDSELRATFGERHPRRQLLSQELSMINEKIRLEIERIVEKLRIEALTATARQASIEHEVERLESAIADRHQAEVQLGELQRELGANREIYQQMLRRYKETREQQEIVDSDFKILSSAEPPLRPATPGAIFFGVVGFSSSLLLLSTFLVLREITDKSVRGTGDVERHLGVKRLGLVPLIRKGWWRRSLAHRYLLANPRSAYSAALHTVLCSLKAGTGLPKMLVVTSSLPAEGKTTFAVSLAICAAQTGKRVILVEGDFRHPSIQRELDLISRRGLVEYALAENDLDQVVEKDLVPGLDVLPLGRKNAFAIPLSDNTLTAQLQALKARYDLVVIDSAPVLGIPETLLLSAQADMVLFVIRWGSTTRNSAKRALEDLASVSASVTGAVLTCVDVRRHASYGYGDAAVSYYKHSRYYGG